MHVCWWWCFWLPLPLFLFWVFLTMLLDRSRTIDCAALQDNHDQVPSNSSKSSLPGLSNRVIPNERSTRRYITQRTPLCPCPCTSTTSRQMPQGVSPPLASLSLSARLPQSLVPRIGLIEFPLGACMPSPWLPRIGSMGTLTANQLARLATNALSLSLFSPECYILLLLVCCSRGQI